MAKGCIKAKVDTEVVEAVSGLMVSIRGIRVG
jgi:hypothetical protein